MNEAFISVDKQDDKIGEIKLDEQNKEKLEAILEDKGVENYQIDGVISGIENQITIFNEGVDGALHIFSGGKIESKTGGLMDEHYIDTGVTDFGLM